MDILVVGLGSMGKRRIRLLQGFSDKIRIIGVDSDQSRRLTASNEYGISVFSNTMDACADIDVKAVFVCTSPTSHADIITDCLNKNLHVFSELNLTNRGYDKNIELAEKKDRVLFLSSTFLYRNEIIRIKEEINRCGCPLSYTYHAGQYLPDWHPWENYKDYFVGNKETSGCRELMAIELPWLIDTFGKITDIKVNHAKISSLEVDYPDVYHVVLTHENGHIGMLSIDVVSRKPVRNFEVYGEALYLKWDGTPNGLFIYDYEEKVDNFIVTYDEFENRSEYSEQIIEDAYMKEIVEFFNVIEKNGKARYSFEKDKYVLSLIDNVCLETE